MALVLLPAMAQTALVLALGQLHRLACALNLPERSVQVQDDADARRSARVARRQPALRTRRSLVLHGCATSRRTNPWRVYSGEKQRAKAFVTAQPTRRSVATN